MCACVPNLARKKCITKSSFWSAVSLSLKQNRMQIYVRIKKISVVRWNTLRMARQQVALFTSWSVVSFLLFWIIYVMQKIISMESHGPDWSSFDDLIMEKIFELLSIRDRFSASLVSTWKWSENGHLIDIIRQTIDFIWFHDNCRYASDGHSV